MALICVTQSVLCYEEEVQDSLTLFYLVPHDRCGSLVDACIEAISTSEGRYLRGNRSFFDAVNADKFLTIRLPAIAVSGTQFQYYSNLFNPNK